MGIAKTEKHLISGGLDGKLQTWSRKDEYAPVTRISRDSGSVIQLHNSGSRLALLSRVGDANGYFVVEILDLRTLEYADVN
jgi:hypothetical protein